jgi:hypothetical protein
MVQMVKTILQCNGHLHPEIDGVENTVHSQVNYEKVCQQNPERLPAPRNVSSFSSLVQKKILKKSFCAYGT